VHIAQSSGHGLERGGDGGMLRRRRLKLGHRGLQVREGGRRVRVELNAPRSLDLVEGAHGLRDGSSELEQALRDVGIRLEGIEPVSQRFPGDARKRDGVGHVR
jgi:hypothetical protein